MNGRAVRVLSDLETDRNAGMGSTMQMESMSRVIRISGLSGGTSVWWRSPLWQPCPASELMWCAPGLLPGMCGLRPGSPWLRVKTRMASGMGGEFRVGEDGLERVEQDGAGDGGLGGYSVGG